jgi:hypothetical protein
MQLMYSVWRLQEEGQVDTCTVMPVNIIMLEHSNCYISNKHKIQFGIHNTCPYLYHMFLWFTSYLRTLYKRHINIYRGHPGVC